MGNELIDKYTLLHFSSGVIAYFWGIDAVKWFLLHLAFEGGENTEAGMKFINENLTFWPGGKNKRDAPINIFGDQVGAMIGWFCAYQLDQLDKD